MDKWLKKMEMEYSFELYIIMIMDKKLLFQLMAFKENKVFHCEGEGPPLGCLYYYILSIRLSFSERSTPRTVFSLRGGVCNMHTIKY